MIKRGKVRAPVEFGHKVFLAESAKGLVTRMSCSGAIRRTKSMWRRRSSATAGSSAVHPPSTAPIPASSARTTSPFARAAASPRWAGGGRRLAKDWENLNRNVLAFLKLASIRLIVTEALQSLIKSSDGL
jgi:hypothetical protein